MFVNRREAGIQLAEKLDQLLSHSLVPTSKANLLIVGLPRGGVPVALEVARKFECPLDIIVAKKLAYPGQPEYAIGAVSSDGVVVLNPDIPNDWQWSAYIEEQRQILLQKTMSVEQQFYELAGCKRSSFKDKVVILVDDGIATGMTAMAAVKAARLRGAARTILAAPVMSSESYYQLRSHCDSVVAISVPEEFNAVGQHYVDFDQTSNEEVISALRESAGFAPQFYSHAQESSVTSVGNGK